MFKVYIPDLAHTPLLLGTRYHDLPFHLEPDKFIYVDNLEDADIIPMIPEHNPDELRQKLEFLNNAGTITRDKIILILSVTNIADGFGFQHSIDQIEAPWKQLSDYVYTVNINSYDNINIFYDFHWNRQKAYFVDYDKYDLHDRLWTTNSTKKMFELSEITKYGVLRHFLMPNRVLQHRGLFTRNVLRQKLHDMVPEHQCLRGDLEKNRILEPQEVNESIIAAMTDSNRAIWYPISAKYYARTFVSLYVESISTRCDSASITEKTLDPMIKGNFVLPYGYPGLVRDIRKMGFLLPEWIDYGYDEIQDDNLRFEAFTFSVKELQEKTIEELHELYMRDRYMLIQNRSLFFNKPYDSLYDLVKKRYENDQKLVFSNRLSSTINTLAT